MSIRIHEESERSIYPQITQINTDSYILCALCVLCVNRFLFLAKHAKYAKVGIVI